MLTHLSIRHFAIVDKLDIDLSSGMTAITGETGAGKSIMLDALALVLGARADSGLVPEGKKRAEISATVDIQHYPQAQQWLEEQQLEEQHSEDGGNNSVCLLRRTVSREGRSQSWINGRQVTLQQLKILGNQLINVHSQHEHQSLLQRETHRHLLDAYGDCAKPAEALNEQYQQWKVVSEKITRLSERSDENSARLQLLRYQIEELDQLDLQYGELAQLEQEQKTLANAEELLSSGQQVLELCEQSVNDNPTIMDLLSQVQHVLVEQKIKTRRLKEAEVLLENARLQMEEACHSIQQHQDELEVNPQRLQEVDQRLGLIYQISRKHRLEPKQLLSFYQQLKEELNVLSGGAEDMSILEQQQEELFKQYQCLASKLSKKRQSTALKLAKAVNTELTRLNMKGSQFKAVLSDRAEAAHVHGNELIEFYICTNPGQPFKPLKKVASGGELSRISLAIQVVTAQTSVIPTLIFDEVDVGIGGETATVVGELLRTLGKKGQVVCVTHQAAVAAKAHQHCYVAKSIAKGKVHTSLSMLSNAERINEVARMLGGEQSSASCAHAEVMLAEAC